jgi:hypothetical protein
MPAPSESPRPRWNALADLENEDEVKHKIRKLAVSATQSVRMRVNSGLMEEWGGSVV